MRRFAASILIGIAPFAIADTPEPANRLAKEKSPYLLQHAHNPVDWYPWGTEAFEKAKKENKPILLSIGYSTCHWCHVMERESFDNPAIAKVINEHFVPIKVDREERPDIDRIYMAFVQATTGSGGWPLNVFLTPEGKPFFGGTYFPPEAKQGMMAFPELLTKVSERWKNDRERIDRAADQVADALKDLFKAKPDENMQVEQAMFDRAAAAFAGDFDKEHGGFTEAPKFPRPAVFTFLLTRHARGGDAGAREMVLKTLRAMADGGMHDQLGGGFHRYSTDARWFLPHFEKMLYDQAQLAEAYLDAWQLTKEVFYADVARGIFEYVLRDLRGPEGQFYSAEDADSARDPTKPKEKTEGAFYVWSATEIEKVIGKEQAAVFNAVYGVQGQGNVAVDPHHEFTGKNVLFVAKGIEEVATRFDRPVEEVKRIVKESKEKLLATRGTRARPHLDDKTLVAWNGLMVSALARGGIVLDEPRYTAAAIGAAEFVRAKLYDGASKALKRSYREGAGAIGGFADDYAFLIDGLIDLYECTLDIQWLKWAIELQGKQDELFWDDQSGGYWSTIADDGLLMRMKELSDNAEPSPNSVAAMNLLRLSQMLDDKAMAQRAERTLGALGTYLRRAPTSAPLALAAVDFHSGKPKQIVLAGKPAEVRAMLREVHGRYLPSRIILCADGAEGQAFLAQRSKFMEFVGPIDGKATAFVCENYVCKEPVTDVAGLRKQLGE